MRRKIIWMTIKYLGMKKRVIRLFMETRFLELIKWYDCKKWEYRKSKTGKRSKRKYF